MLKNLIGKYDDIKFLIYEIRIVFTVWYFTIQWKKDVPGA